MIKTKPQKDQFFELNVKEETTIAVEYGMEKGYDLRCDNTDVRHSIVNFFGKENSDDTKLLFMRKQNTHFLLAEKLIDLSKFKSYRVDVFTASQLADTDKLFLVMV